MMSQAPKTIAQTMGEAYANYILTSPIEWAEDDGKPVVFRDMIKPPMRKRPEFREFIDLLGFQYHVVIDGPLMIMTRIQVKLPHKQPLKWRSDYA